MNNTLKLYIFLIFVLIGGIVFLDANVPKPINWSPTYSVKDKIPFGLYVFDKELGSICKGQKIEKLNITPYEYFPSQYNYDTLVNNYKVNGTFLSVSEFSTIDDESIDEIMTFVSYGNNAFISSKYISQHLLDSLKIEINSEFNFKDSTYNWLANPRLGTQKYKMSEGIGNTFFSKIDTLNTTVLGYQNGDSTRVNFIKINYENGSFYLHTQPAAFTNFHLLKGNHHEYAEKVLSYLHKETIFWYNKNQDGEVISASPMRYILNQPALKWAWYLFLIGIAVFMVFNAKRKQRIVPIIKPLANTTIDFAKTIGNLYYQEGDHNNIIDKKIIYFLERIRNEYLMDTTVLNDDFIKKLHHKSGKDLADIKNAVHLINTHRRLYHNGIEEDLIQLNNALEKIIN
ncbi:MAG: DUF4350 domain-containing protein [Bacteroidota bacterium]